MDALLYNVNFTNMRFFLTSLLEVNTIDWQIYSKKLHKKSADCSKKHTKRQLHFTRDELVNC